jgi:hypothetical protein
MLSLEREERLAAILKELPAEIAYSEHVGGDSEAFRLERVVSN